MMTLGKKYIAYMMITAVGMVTDESPSLYVTRVS